jgi:hypothetical protein
MPKRFHLNRPDLAKAVAETLAICEEVRDEWHLVKAQQKWVFPNGFSGQAALLRRQPPNR